MFVDRVVVFVKGGDGGKGRVAFHREKYVMVGPPDGGDGGKGGSVIVQAVAGTDSLANIVPVKHWRAEKGGDGGGNNRHGADGGDRTIIVPPGTIVRDRDRKNILKDLTKAGDEVVVGKGGRGGRGNRHFANSINRSPTNAEPGEKGEERHIILELKLIADVGLVGLPNAGKSTMLSRLSRAQPEIADYPFTTKFPNLGVVYVGGEHAFVLADLPGLIEGAHQGVGLGLEFLRHVERNRVLIHLVEPFPIDESDPIRNYHIVRQEIENYSKVLAAKPEVVAVSKSELTESEEVRKKLSAEIGKEVIGVSAATGQGLSQLVGKVSLMLKEIPIPAPVAPEPPEVMLGLPTS